jgi:hypothetical protein
MVSLLLYPFEGYNPSMKTGGLYRWLHSTSGIYIYCNTLTFQAPSISALFCNYLSIYTVFTASTTYAEQTDHAFTPTVAQFAVSSTSTSASSSSVNTESSSTKSSSTATPTATPSSGRGKKTNKGAIIGGVVGGFVGLALITAAVVLFLMWRNTTVNPPGEGEPVGNSVAVQATK